MYKLIWFCLPGHLCRPLLTLQAGLAIQVGYELSLSWLNGDDARAAPSFAG